MRPLFRSTLRERLAARRRPLAIAAAAFGVAALAMHLAPWSAADARELRSGSANHFIATAEGAGPRASTPSPEVTESATVPLLVASPSISHPLYANAVIFAAPLPAGGHLGIILNRPTEAKLGDMFPDHPPSREVAEPVFFGGPVQREVIVAVIRADAKPSEAAMPIARDMYIAFDAPTIDEAIEKNKDRSRFYAGFVVWPPQQLAEQLAAGLWSVKEVDAKKMLQKPTGTLWRELALPAQNGGTRFIAHRTPHRTH